MELVSGLVLFGLVLFGVEVEDGLEVLFGFVEFMSELLELEFGVALGLLPEFDGEVEFMSGLAVEDGEVVDDGELELLLLGLD